jgi:hypothetical protein
MLFPGLIAILLCLNMSYANTLNFYTGGEKLLNLEPPPAKVDYYLDLKGTSGLKQLILELADSKGKKKLAIPLNPDGSFAVRYLIKTGPGDYRINLFGSKSATSLSYDGLAYFNLLVTGYPPEQTEGTLNQKVLDFVNSVMGKTVGRGECWDVAQAVLDREGADWSRPVSFGKVLDPLKDKILPGDIIQFSSLVIKEKLTEGRSRTEFLGDPDHTSIVYEVLGPLHYKLAHQNLGGKRFVQVTELNLNNRTSGQYWIYRPVPAILKL